MKKNDWIFLSSVAAYSALFYDAGAGINFLIFSAILILFQLIRNIQVLKSGSWIIAALAALATSSCIFFYGNGLSVFANVLSLMLLSAFSFQPKTSLITSLFFSAYSIMGALVFMILDTIGRLTKRVVKASENTAVLRFMMYAFPLIVVLIFFFLYKGANPLFDNLTKKISLDFISAGWVVFTILGTFLLYGFYYHRTIAIIERDDQSAPNDLDRELSEKTGWLRLNLSIENEVRSGTILFLLLNALLLFVNALDLQYLWCDGTLPKGMNYSDFVHQGTGLLIMSILIAILIIMFYFRGAVNFYKKNKLIRGLAFFWIIQNAFMIISTVYRNNIYVHEYYLTYKRIGVYVWLLLALIGLSTTFFKILKAKTNRFLFRANSWLFFAVLIASCFVNWDMLVTNYNISQAVRCNKAIDKRYLTSLSDANLPVLLQLSDAIRSENLVTDSDWSSGSSRISGSYDQEEFKVLLSEKLQWFLRRMKNEDWRSLNRSDEHTLQQLIKLNVDSQIPELKFANGRFCDLEDLSQLTNLQALSIDRVYIGTYDVLRLFPHLKKLTIRNMSIQNLAELPRMDELTELSLSATDLRNIFSLKRYQKLEKLDLSGNPLITSFAVLRDLKSLKYLKIGMITKQGFVSLSETFPQLKIDATINN